MLITDSYRAANIQLHKSKATYGASGQKWTNKARKLAKAFDTIDILDYGCGKGTLQRSLKFPIHEYDPAIPGKDMAPEPADIVFCTDVLEHVEPGLIDSVIADIRRVTKKYAFLTISTRPAKKTLPDGRNAHLIVQPWEWWEPKFSAFQIHKVKHTDEEILLEVS